MLEAQKGVKLAEKQTLMSLYLRDFFCSKLQYNIKVFNAPVADPTRFWTQHW